MKSAELLLYFNRSEEPEDEQWQVLIAEEEVVDGQGVEEESEQLTVEILSDKIKNKFLENTEKKLPS